ncbi:hypothetical protein F3N42_07355 [Marinihelvus fidelis]|uniref:Uncharacterized protein n=1 Tax=Marinihelvus fidelis TaxID=2613842 RepID=A0A5N0TB65_9GAMM|nr:hypothetical protein [Marinihelvus fidelis]KAA9131981.1 hypothetical protein F3N42_07355 [Marinihelvus fidelis]
MKITLKMCMAPVLVLAGSLLVSISGFADDVSGARHLLCATSDVHVCRPGEGCDWQSPEAVNVPRFIRVDTRSGEMSTTAASHEQRVSTATSVTQQDGEIILQGVENRRSFSLVVDATTGTATFAAATRAQSVTVFGACTTDE